MGEYYLTLTFPCSAVRDPYILVEVPWYRHMLLIHIMCTLFLLLTADVHRPDVKHPTASIRRTTLTLLRALALCTGIEAEDAQKEAVGALCGLIRNVIDSGCNQGLSKSPFLSHDNLTSLFDSRFLCAIRTWQLPSLILEFSVKHCSQKQAISFVFVGMNLMKSLQLVLM